MNSSNNPRSPVVPLNGAEERSGGEQFAQKKQKSIKIIEKEVKRLCDQRQQRGSAQTACIHDPALVLPSK